MGEKVTRWVGWRRPTAGGAWQEVASGATKGLAFDALVTASELTAGPAASYEYEILPEGQRPVDRWASRQAYGNRAMRPW